MSQSWDRWYLDLARFTAGKSKDPSTKVGCVIVGETNEVRSLGYNGFPRGVNDDIASRWERPAKYKYCEHSERNAIYNCARSGVSTMAATLYLASYPAKLGPCDECCRGIIQSGIARVVYEVPAGDIERWKEACAVGEEMLREAGVQVDLVVPLEVT